MRQDLLGERDVEFYDKVSALLMVLGIQELLRVDDNIPGLNGGHALSFDSEFGLGSHNFSWGYSYLSAI